METNLNISIQQAIHKHEARQPALPTRGGSPRDFSQLHASSGRSPGAAVGAGGGARATRPAAGQGGTHNPGSRAQTITAGY